jgi:hypothetical protein
MSVRLDEIRDELAEIKTAKQNVYRNGQQYASTGAFSASNADLKTLLHRERQLRNELAMLSGARPEVRE